MDSYALTNRLSVSWSVSLMFAHIKFPLSIKTPVTSCLHPLTGHLRVIASSLFVRFSCEIVKDTKPQVTRE